MDFPTIQLTPAEQAFLAAIRDEVETLHALGHSDEAIGLAVNLAINLGSIELTPRTLVAA
jgi:hypothetical protein